MKYAKTQKELGGPGRVSLVRKDKRTAIIPIIHGEGAVMLLMIAE